MVAMSGNRTAGGQSGPPWVVPPPLATAVEPSFTTIVHAYLVLQALGYAAWGCVWLLRRLRTQGDNRTITITPRGRPQAVARYVRTSLSGQVDLETGKEHYRDLVTGQPLADPERRQGRYAASTGQPA